MEEQIKALSDRLESQQDYTRRMEESFRKMLQETMQQFTQSLRDVQDRVGNRSSGDSPRNPEFRTIGYVPKLDFPKFDGQNPRMWIKKCENYFALCKIHDDQKVAIACLNMTDKAESWMSSYVVNKRNASWSEFILDLCARFKDDVGFNVVERFNKLQQLGGLDAYVDEFDHLRSIMLQQNQILPDSYFLDSFVGGLKSTSKSFVRALKPSTVAEAIEFARLQEENVEANKQFYSKTTLTTRNFNKPELPFPSHIPSTTKFSLNNNTHSSNPSYFKPKPRITLTPAQRREKQLKGLCYFCDQPYEKGHECKMKQTQLFLVEIPGSDDIKGEGYLEEIDEKDDLEFLQLESVEPSISVNALSGSNGFHTMRVTGNCKNANLHILIDSGSTHNFLDIAVAKKLGLEMEPIATQSVTVADGNHLACGFVCRGVEWKIQSISFKSDMLIIPLGGCDMVLGIQWLSKLGTVSWNFKQLQMEFDVNGEHCVLRGIAPQKAKIIWDSQQVKVDSMQLYFLQLNSCGDDRLQVVGNAIEKSKCPACIEEVLGKNAYIFDEPTQLPPSRGIFDHKIPLEFGANPVSIRPYRYPLKQRDIIEKLVREMLDQGIIRDSRSPFASPVVLVGKKDGSWRLCVDYRSLNDKTIKDKFPIPVVDELIDELAGSSVFSKIDLRAGYHQLRVDANDVYKTAFKTHNGHYEFLVMPFGLTNAPASFQAWMNHIFRSMLRKNVLVFFDDILVYSPSLEQHVFHLQEVFSLMTQHTLFAKRSKCSFAIEKVEYLGHFISGRGVETDPQKIATILNWPSPQNVKELRSFLGLTGYYRKFIKGYACLIRNLTQLLKKGEFVWDTTAEAAFQALKQAMGSPPVLALPDFSLPFEIETDASNTGIGAVLMQKGHPLAFLSKSLGPKWQKLSVYEKELLAVVTAVQKWEQYLTGQTFIIKTDQKSLKWLLQQKVSTPFQQFWLSKLMGFQYEIQYRSGQENVVADALSRVSGSELMCLALSVVNSNLTQLIQQSYALDPNIQNLWQSLNQGEQVRNFSVVDDLIRRKNKLLIGPDRELKRSIFEWLHSSGMGGHSGRDATLKRIKSIFYWRGMTAEVTQLVRHCLVCQANKPENLASPGLLQPLPIPQEVWLDVSMDFISGLPKSKGKDVIMVVVDRLSKMAHFMTLSHPFTSEEVAQIYLDNVFKLHGWPRTIISDRDPIFLSNFWKSLFSIQGSELLLSSSYHPQTDGQTEVVNKCLETFLRCMCGERPREWSLWMSLAEWWYNTNYHTSIQATPYEIVYNQAPPIYLPYLPGESKVEAVDRTLQKREAMIKMLKFHLQRAQNRMKTQADKHRSERSFEKGAWVWLKLQPYRQKTLRQDMTKEKLSARFFGPFQITEKIGSVAYKLKLPEGTQVHPVFHVSQLKLVRGELPAVVHIPTMYHNQSSDVVFKPSAILDRRVVKQRNQAQVQYLVQWEGYPISEATWEDAEDFEQKHPEFAISQLQLYGLEAKTFFKEAGM